MRSTRTPDQGQEREGGSPRNLKMKDIRIDHVGNGAPIATDCRRELALGSNGVHCFPIQTVAKARQDANVLHGSSLIQGDTQFHVPLDSEILRLPWVGSGAAT